MMQHTHTHRERGGGPGERKKERERDETEQGNAVVDEAIRFKDPHVGWQNQVQEYWIGINPFTSPHSVSICMRLTVDTQLDGKAAWAQIRYIMVTATVVTSSTQPPSWRS